MNEKHLVLDFNKKDMKLSLNQVAQYDIDAIYDNIDKFKTCDSGSKRHDTKMLIKQLLEYNPLVEKNIFKSAANVNLDMILGYKHAGKMYSYLDDYENKEAIDEKE